MHSSRLLGAALLCALMLLSDAQVMDTESEEELSPRALRDFYPKGPNLTSEKQLVRAPSGSTVSPVSFLLMVLVSDAPHKYTQLAKVFHSPIRST